MNAITLALCYTEDMGKKSPPIPFQATDWATIAPTIHPGETGTAYWRTVEYPGLRIRHVDYSDNYLADHWCKKGHLLFVIEGTLISELKTGQKITLTAGMSYQVSDDQSEHRSYSPQGAKLIIVDGDFLKSE